MTRAKSSSKSTLPKFMSAHPVISLSLAGLAIAGGAVAVGDPPPPRTEALEARPAAVVMPIKSTSTRPDPVLQRGRKVAQAAYDAGWRGRDLRIAIAVSRAESAWRNVSNEGLNSDGSVDYGEFQVNKSAHPGLFRKYSWKSTKGNAMQAHAVWAEAKKRGNPWKPWSKYNNGEYHQYMSVADRLAREVEK